MLWTFRERFRAALAAYRNPKLVIYPEAWRLRQGEPAKIPCPSVGCQLQDGHLTNHGLWYEWTRYPKVNALLPSQTFGSWAKVAELDSDH